MVEVERLISKIERKLDGLGDVNMLAIEQYDETANRIEQLIEDGSTLRKRRDMLVDIVDRLEDERKSRLLAVFEHISEKQDELMGLGSERLGFFEINRIVFKERLKIFMHHRSTGT